ncbi:related to UPC2 - regulatory protein involved in control of sterol uptake [Cephalotrichum gorgonifer]|uniref:Related to UPC2 - regulatory protein involved in control of sterol uptake n=1 Tax=Cephalotrichum gorgonifer TaxID=2041049 RepID=A0AAE8SYJ6_9PEZI|nr:related to UPC2 - regulatory protein involved in control of sterol uptake [Cephalotrichum gorgonifer]
MEPLEMPLDAGESHAQHQPPLPGASGDGNEENDRKKSAVRKRTKTGCQTCRKRRIKCDEGRPRCGNCMKSKRECEGYTQRVVFKETMGAYGGPYGVMGGYPVDPSHGGHPYVNPSVSGHPQPPPQQPSAHSSHPVLAPRPPSFDFHGQQPHHPHISPTYGEIGTAHPAPGAFNFNDPYSVPPMPPTPSVVSSTSSSQPPEPNSVTAAPWGGFPEQGNGAPPPAATAQYAPDRLRCSDSPMLESRDRITAAYDPDIDIDDASVEEMASASDDEQDLATMDQQQQLVRTRRLNTLIDGSAIAHHEVDDTRMRTFSAYAQGNILTTYTPSAKQSGLTDAQTLAVFRHFIYVTGPSMSLYERHPFDHSKVSSEIPIPQSGQNIWTYTFPILSLGHPPLLQAMLALGALQIANLQRIPPTAAMKHYHLAIRRISKSVRSATKRAHPATLAATLLLGYFEVWSADHTKWCRHLYGARILFREVPFRHMTRTVMAAKAQLRERMEQERLNPLLNPILGGYDDDSLPDPQLEDIDVDFLSVIAGRELDPEDYGIGVDLDSLPSAHVPTDRDIEHYEHLRDLFWWNCKMDVIQSILGATRLFMRYDEWLPCPPRAPMGNLHAIYGTFDHLLLLLGRLSEFTSDDLPRKRKVNALPGPPGGGGSPPMFPGMFPTPGKVSAPMGFSPPPREASPQSDGMDEGDLEKATRAALETWESIRLAFESFRSRLGPSFQPLGDEYVDRRETPFGTAVQYRTFSVAGIWLTFYMGLICLYRAHPSMPPAAMMAAGRSARETAPFAKEIGRIAAGLSDEDLSNSSEITTLVGAAFIECSFPLFVAGIQYTDAAQRRWLVHRLHDISRLTGWGSARQIAAGCEAAWVRAAQMGRGPPYLRHSEEGTPVAMGSNPRRIDRKIWEMTRDGTVGVAKADRAHLALGLLAIDGDMDRLKLVDE